MLWSKGSLTPVAEGGQLMPDGGVLGYTFSPIAMNQNDEIAFIMSRDGYNEPPPLGLDAGVYRYSARTGVIPVMVPGLQSYNGNAFWGSGFFASINNRRDIAFPAMLCTSLAISVAPVPCPDCSSRLLSKGIFKGDAKGGITPVMMIGDPAPSGVSYFDNATFTASNDGGDVAFAAHVYGQACGFQVCGLYLKPKSGDKVDLIATAGAPSPVPGKNYSSAFSPVINSTGDVAFLGDLSATGDGSEVAVFLYRGGKVIVVAKPGDPMPGGGTFASNGQYQQNVFMNNQGEVVFAATLSSGANGLYIWRHGVTSLVAQTGTDTGSGVILSLDDFLAGAASSQVSINDAGRILFMAKYFGGGGGLLVATPK